MMGEKGFEDFAADTWRPVIAGFEADVPRGALGDAAFASAWDAGAALSLDDAAREAVGNR